MTDTALEKIHLKGTGMNLKILKKCTKAEDNDFKINRRKDSNLDHQK
jgi:hypothetical protein